MINLLLVIFLEIYGESLGVQGASDPTFLAKAGQFNYFVMVCQSGKFYCSGTIIDQRHIITKASCVFGIPSSNLSIIAGTIDAKVSETRLLPIESVYIHYGFKAITNMLKVDENEWLHDIAVLKLVNQMNWNLVTAPAVLTTGGSYWMNDCVVPGWRHTAIGTNREHYYIRWNRGKTHTDSYCTAVGVRLLKNEECASWEIITRKFAGTMHYYSGSPIVCQDVVIGIVDGRRQKQFHVFLRLFPYKDFIENAIDDRKYDVNPGDINYVVSVWYEYRFKCGGIIFGASHILTTADCVQYANPTRLQVIAGRTQILDQDDQIIWLSVNNIEFHPNYEEIIYFDGPRCMHAKNNYALLTLAVSLEWGPTIGPASLPNTDFFPTNPMCGAYRWHTTYTVDDKVLLQLIWSQEVIMDAEVCHQAGIGLEADEICVNSLYAHHPKNFDSSGNPLVCEGFVIGIITPDYSTVPQFSHLTGILSISPFMNYLNEVCYIPPID